MNIILKSFDGSAYDNPFIERALNGLPLGTCISVINDDFLLPNIAAGKHIRISANAMREGRYDAVDWNTIGALDAELIESMRHTEAIFMTMVERYVRRGDLPYHQRKRQYLQHLRYWNHMLEGHHIDLLLLNHQPHQCYDYVLYNLCKLKGIKTLYLERATVIDAFFVLEDWEQSGGAIRDRYLTLKQELSDPRREVPLSENYEAYFQSYTKETPEPWFMHSPRFEQHTRRRSFAAMWWRKALRELRLHPLRFLRSIVSIGFWANKLRQHGTIQTYFRNVRTPDLTLPYVYVALHMQPEMSTSPLAGAFVDQELIIQLLASCLPKGVRIYVKEHPMQTERCRSAEFYESLLENPSVTFVPRDTDTFLLIEHAAAVATGTGTAGFQALFRGKPVFLFGHRFFQFAPGIHRITTKQDCQHAIESIFKGKGAPNLRDLRIFLKAVEELATPYTGIPHSPHEKFTQEEKGRMMGDTIGRKVREVFGLSEASVHVTVGSSPNSQ
ncbi:MAG: hypothetical protein PHI23_04530 [Candidatus Peribacteraceae bacterium]|nr:hypothetical protein [Candidatus Peribacteraceae bacterium]